MWIFLVVVGVIALIAIVLLRPTADAPPADPDTADPHEQPATAEPGVTGRSERADENPGSERRPGGDVAT
ncbi:MAG: hypothetical protein ABJH68_07255 [Ilumatobacter sp.]|uniref:hypothetical protein n=1 Tax=Ilumatobacter sp. TaxID=1967498 RepID=UPI00329A3AFA